MAKVSRHSCFEPSALVCAALLLASCGDGDNDNNKAANNPTPDMGTVSDMSSMEGDTSTSDDTGQVACGDPTGMRPPRISEHAGAFVSGAGGGTLVVFGGSLGIPENCDFPQRTYETTTWLYDVDCDAWSTLESTPTPTGRARHTAVYDATNDRVIVYGGLGASGPLGDTWALDMASGEWSEVQTSGGPPPARLNHTAAYDPSGRMLVFGGNTGSSVINIQPANDVWALDLATDTWTDVTPAAVGPDPRLWVASLWDPEREQLVVYGGGDDSAFTGMVSYFADAWAWSDGDGEPGWVELGLPSTEVPPGRFWPGWTYDPVNDRYVLFGGHDAGNVDGATLGNRNDTWFLDPDTGQWEEHLAGDVWNKPANGFCDFPADFTVIEEASPERRNAHVFISGPNAAYSMGGKTDCGVIDDLARFQFDTAEWANLTRATFGEVCLRKGGGDTCSGLCL